jgi:5-methylcytosine-specific restriction endonuclease McrA
MSTGVFKKFYNSKVWRKTRGLYFNSKHGLCEICGSVGEEVHHIVPLTRKNLNNERITLDFDNLMLLCKQCHFDEHGPKPATVEGTYFHPITGELLKKEVYDGEGEKDNKQNQNIKNSL